MKSNWLMSTWLQPDFWHSLHTPDPLHEIGDFFRNFKKIPSLERLSIWISPHLYWIERRNAALLIFTDLAIFSVYGSFQSTSLETILTTYCIADLSSVNLCHITVQTPYSRMAEDIFISGTIKDYQPQFYRVAKQNACGVYLKELSLCNRKMVSRNLNKPIGPFSSYWFIFGSILLPFWFHIWPSNIVEPS